MDGHGDFHILNVVLVEGEYAVLIVLTHDGGGGIAAAIVSDLETLIDGSAAHDFHAAAAGDKAPGIQGGTAIYGDLTAACHFDKGHRTGGSAVIAKLGAQLVGNCQRAIHREVCALCHGKGTENTGLCVSVFMDGGLIGVNRAGSIEGNIQRNAGRNGIVTGGQSAVAGQGDDLVGSRSCIGKCRIKAFKQKAGAVCKEYRCCGRLSKHGPNGHILSRNQLIGSRGGEHCIGGRIDPGHELAAAARGCHKSAAGGRADRIHGAGSNGSAIQLYRAKAAVGHGNIGLSSYFLNLKTAQGHGSRGTAGPASCGDGKCCGSTGCQQFGTGAADLITAKGSQRAAAQIGAGIAVSNVSGAAGCVGNRYRGCFRRGKRAL